MENLNSFQKWAIEYCAEHGLTATACGNWVEIEKRGNPAKCMTFQEVRDAVEVWA